MNKLIKVLVSLVISFALASSAVAEPCVPVPPKDVTGEILIFPVIRRSIAASYFEQNNCDWGGNTQLNGFDAVVLDVEGMGGPASVTATVTNLSLVPMEGIFLNKACERLGEPAPISTSANAYPMPTVVTIPADAKWMIAEVATDLPAGDPASEINVKVHSEGKECTAVTPPKKKKKRRG